jgi:glucoside 3-dehydrogenase (cytochrome c) hitch-hiker subunit
VHRFVDTMLVEYYAKAEREHFVSGLVDLDARGRGECGGPFLLCSAAQQRRLVEQLDRETFEGRGRAVVATEASKETERGGGGTSDRPVADPQARALPSFFRTMKELTIVGYYTSQLGATKELRYVQVPGRFEGCVPLAKIGRGWAT